MKALKKGIKLDCRYFDGAKPCQFRAFCESCDLYSPAGKRILIIKLASIGDVLRTTPILPALKKRYPGSFITWLAKEPAEKLLEGNHHIDRVMVYGLNSILALQVEKFDLGISLDKAVEAAAFAELISADEKRGYGLNNEGKIYPFNKEAEYSFILGLDDESKFFKNKKTYQEMIFEIAKLSYNNEPYALILSKKELDFADRFFRKNNLDTSGAVIGINTGAGNVFANKNLKKEKIIKLIGLLNKQLGAKVLLLGGPSEREMNQYIVKNAGCKVINAGCGNSLKDFSALVNRCSVVIAADTLALHIAIALKRPVVALFGPTCPQEIYLYNRGRKIITEAECAPCYKNECDKEVTCMDKIDLDKIVKAAKGLM